MSILKHEFYKVLSKKMLLLFILALFLLNSFIYINERRNDVKIPEVYYTLEKVYSRYTADEAMAEIDRLENELAPLSWILHLQSQNMPIDLIKENVEALHSLSEKGLSFEKLIEKYRDSKFSKDKDYLNDYNYSLNILKEQLQYIRDYPEFISVMSEKADSMLSVSIFSKPNTFAYRNIIKTPEAFEHLKNIELKLGPEKGIVTASRFEITDFFVLAFIFLLCIFLFMHEKEKGLDKLVRATMNGRTPVIISKLVVISSIVAVVCAMFYGSILFIGYLYYGFGDITRNIQSISAFRDCSLLLTVRQYIILFIVTKMVIGVFTSFVFSLFFNLLTSAKSTYAGIGLFAVVSYLCYTFIHPASVINILKYINLFSFFNVFKLYGEYTNINLFGFPVELTTAALFTISISMFIIVILNISTYARSRSGSADLFSVIISKLVFRRKKFTGSASLFIQESYKIIVSGKVYIIILLALVIGYMSIDFAPLLIGKDGAVYKYYVDSVAGRLTPEKERMLQDEREKFEMIPTEIERLSNERAKGIISGEAYSEKMRELELLLEQREGFDRLYSQYQYLLNLKEEKNIDSSFICEISSDYIFNSRKRDVLNSLLYCVLLIICISNIFPIDYRNNMINVLKCTWYGRLKLFITKCQIAALISLVLFALVYAPSYINLLIKYDINDWSAPIQSIAIYKDVSIDMSILEFMILVNLLKIAGCFAMTMFILLISEFVKNQSYCIFASTVLFTFPLLINLSGLTFIDTYTMNRCFLLFDPDNWKSFSGLLYYFISLVLLWAGALFSGGLIFCTKKTSTYKFRRSASHILNDKHL